MNERETFEVKVLNPLENFREETQLLEYRVDPLTGLVSIIQRSGYFKELFKSEPEALAKLSEETKVKCPFCPPRVEEVTPKFPSSLLPEGRLKVGSCLAFPNLFAHTDFNAVVVLGEEHFRPPGKLDSKLLFEGLQAALEVLRKVGVEGLGVKFGSIVMNYLPPAGSSIFHPHMQVLGSTLRDFNLQRILVEASKAYFEKHGENFWRKLIEEEAGGPRFLFREGKTWWFTSFAPLRSFEVQGVVEDASNLLSLGEEEISSLAAGISKILRCYSLEGIFCFNLAIYSAPLNADFPFNVNVRVSARFGLNPLQVNDAWSLPYLLLEGFSLTPPEELASTFRRHLG